MKSVFSVAPIALWGFVFGPCWGLHRGLGDLGRRAIYFQGVGGALVIIFRDLGSKLKVLRI